MLGSDELGVKSSMPLPLNDLNQVTQLLSHTLTSFATQASLERVATSGFYAFGIDNEESHPPTPSHPLLFWPCHKAGGILVLQPGTEPRPSAAKTQSPNYWTARGAPEINNSLFENL